MKIHNKHKHKLSRLFDGHGLHCFHIGDKVPLDFEAREDRCFYREHMLLGNIATVTAVRARRKSKRA